MTLKNLTSVVLVIISVSFLLYAKNKGMTGSTLKNGEGCDCHGDISNKVSVVINGPDEIKKGEITDYQVVITGGPMINAGVNIAVSQGDLIAGKGLKLSKKELTHIEPVKATDKKVVFDFKYKASGSANEIIIYATGNSGNGNDAKRGDLWNHAQNKNVKILN